MIDTHCHLYVTEFDNDRRAMFERAKSTGVTEFYLPAIDSSTHEAMLNVENEFGDSCRAMMGLHPCSVKADYQYELEIIHQHLTKRRFSGIGETGLDFYWDKTFVEQQYLALHQQAEWAIEFNTPLILHTREALDETIEVISGYKGKGLRGIFHCFGGNIEQAARITDLGFHLGIGGVITYKKSGLSEVIKHVSPEYIVLETDAPYLTPVPFRGKRNESSYLHFIAEEIARSRNISVEMVDEFTTRNAENLFHENV